MGGEAEVALPAGIERAAGGVSLPTNAGWMLMGLPRAARRARVDLFHAPSYTAPVAGPRPLVVTIHDVVTSGIRSGIRTNAIRYDGRSIVEALQALTASSPIQNSPEPRSSRPRLASRSITVVPLAAGRVFQPGPPLPLPTGWPTHYVLHVGDLHERRNLPMVARAVAAVRAQDRSRRDLTLVLMGSDYGGGQALRALHVSGPGGRRRSFRQDRRGDAPRRLSIGDCAGLSIAVRRVRPASARIDGLWDPRYCRADVIYSRSDRRRSRTARSRRRGGLDRSDPAHAGG